MKTKNILAIELHKQYKDCKKRYPFGQIFYSFTHNKDKQKNITKQNRTEFLPSRRKIRIRKTAVFAQQKISKAAGDRDENEQ